MTVSVKPRETTEPKAALPPRLADFAPYRDAMRDLSEYKQQLADAKQLRETIATQWSGPIASDDGLTVIQRLASARVDGRVITPAQSREDSLRYYSDLCHEINVLNECIRLKQVVSGKAHSEFSRTLCNRWFPSYQAAMQKIDNALAAFEVACGEKDEFLKSVDATGAKRTPPILVIHDGALREAGKTWRYVARHDKTLIDEAE